MTTIVRAAGAAEFLSVVPQLLGCHVSRSLVLVPFDGSRTVGALRVDLPDEEGDADGIAATLIGMVCKLPKADGVAFVAYTDELTIHGLPHRAMSEAVGRRAESCGLRVVDSLCVAADGWGSYLDPERPGSGRPLSELGDASPPGLERLPEPAADQTAGLALPVLSPSDTAAAEQALAAFAHAVEVVCGPAAADERGSFGERRPAGVRIDPRSLTASLLLDDLPHLYEQALTWDTDDFDPHEGAALIWCLSRPALRDIALVCWSGHIGDADEALEAQLRWEQGEEYPPHLALRMWGDGSRPEPQRLMSALALTRSLAARTPDSDRAGVLSMCAWLSWALGRSTHAAHYAGLACAAEPGYGLAEIVQSFVDAGHLPEWAFDRRAT